MTSFAIFRLLKINFVMMRYSVLNSLFAKQSLSARIFLKLNPWNWRRNPLPRGEALCKSFESLGPIFVKFGQVLSTRRDLFPEDIVNALAKLQDNVTPFSEQKALTLLEKAYKKPINDVFKQFDNTPLASASVAQVHSATLPSGEKVVVKIIRPNIEKTIANDINVLYKAAKLAERFHKSGKRLHPVDLVKEFEQTIYDELDLLREAANASQLRRNFDDSKIMYVPKVYWDYCKQNIMVMERIFATPMSDLDTLKKAKVNMKVLAENGVEIFFTQVFRDSFFHADMHPGNLFVDISNPQKPVYCGVDFGIMGTLSAEDQYYLAENVMAFFDCDYRRVAELHVECGWVPKDTRVDQFEAAIRTVCEPIFQKPLNEISFGQLLLRLFRTAERFNMEIQPQLMLLQKTLLNIEGLGRDLYPELDLWATAKPILKQWMRERYNLKGTIKKVVREFPKHLQRLLETPDLIFDLLEKAKQRYN